VFPTMPFPSASIQLHLPTPASVALTWVALPDLFSTCLVLLPVCGLSPISILHTIGSSQCALAGPSLSTCAKIPTPPGPHCVVGNGASGSCDADCNSGGCYRAQTRLDLGSLTSQSSVNDGVMACSRYYVVKPPAQDRVLEEIR
jgi:hypothetical protein